MFFACTYEEERGPSDEPDFVWTAVRLCIADPELDVANSIVDYVFSTHNMEVVKLYDLYHCVIPDQHHRDIQLNYLVTVKDSASSTGGGRFPDPSVTRTSWLYSSDLNNGQKYGIGISEEFRNILRPMKDPAHAWTTTHIRSVIALVRSIKRGNIKQAAAEEKDDKERGLRIKSGMPGLMIEDGQQRR